MMHRSFHPEIHTQDARRNQAVAIHDGYPDLVLVGSLGRGLLMGVEPPVNQGAVARDIDYISMDSQPFDFSPEDHAPFFADNVFPEMITVDHDADQATVMTDIEFPEVSVEMPAKVFEPYPVRIAGHTINTLHPDMLMRLFKIRPMRKKDKANLQTFRTAMQQANYIGLNDKDLEPFDELESMTLQNSRLRRKQAIARLGVRYWELTPDCLQDTLRPAVRPIRRLMELAATK